MNESKRRPYYLYTVKPDKRRWPPEAIMWAVVAGLSLVTAIGCAVLLYMQFCGR